MDDFDERVVEEAALDEVGPRRAQQVGQRVDEGGVDAEERPAAGAVDLPPGGGAGAQVQPVAVLVQQAHVQVQAHQQRVPRQPHHLPRPILFSSRTTTTTTTTSDHQSS